MWNIKILLARTRACTGERRGVSLFLSRAGLSSLSRCGECYIRKINMLIWVLPVLDSGTLGEGCSVGAHAQACESS